jgi:hypothetical protein
MKLDFVLLDSRPLFFRRSPFLPPVGFADLLAHAQSGAGEQGEGRLNRMEIFPK